MTRRYQLLLITSTLLGSWLGMQAIHELGHVLGASLTGGRVAQVVLHPITISRTDLAHNPSPLLVVWAGPLFGVIAPLFLYAIARLIKLPGHYVLRFFAGFCLLANGLYIAGGALEGIGDCGVMLKHGAPPWHLYLFGVLTAPFGLWLWHNQGQHFGLGKAKGVVDQRVTLITTIICLILLLIAFIVDGI